MPSIEIFIDGSYGLVTPGAYRTDLYVINASAVESVFLGTIHLARVLTVGLLANSTVRPPGQAAPSPRCWPYPTGCSPAWPGGKTLADEHGPTGIRVNRLLPARVATDRMRQMDALLDDPDEVRAGLREPGPPVGAGGVRAAAGTR